MATKTISITEEAYGILKSWKGERDSFSSVIARLGKKQDLTKYAGILSKKSAQDLRESVMESRATLKKRYQ